MSLSECGTGTHKTITPARVEQFIKDAPPGYAHPVRFITKDLSGEGLADAVPRVECGRYCFEAAPTLFTIAIKLPDGTWRPVRCSEIKVADVFGRPEIPGHSKCFQDQGKHKRSRAFFEECDSTTADRAASLRARL